jgi:hypothetical protein
MASQIKTALVNLTSAMQALGIFDKVQGVEPKQPPGNGVTAAIYLNSVGPAAKVSGLDRASALYVFTLRLYSNMLKEPAEDIDPNLVACIDGVFDALAGDLDLGASVRNIDYFGECGTPLSAKAGYVDVSGTMFRCIDITIPLIVNDTMEAFA